MNINEERPPSIYVIGIIQHKPPYNLPYNSPYIAIKHYEVINYPLILFSYFCPSHPPFTKTTFSLTPH